MNSIGGFPLKLPIKSFEDLNVVDCWRAGAVSTIPLTARADDKSYLTILGIVW